MANIVYPLASSTWGDEEINAIQKVIATDMYTMGSHVKEFEKEYAKHFGHEHAVMTNSGSSANLLMLALLKLKYKLTGDIIVPAVGWSTSYFPVNQNGFRLHFVDVDPNTYNIDPKKIEDAISKTENLPESLKYVNDRKEKFELLANYIEKVKKYVMNSI